MLLARLIEVSAYIFLKQWAWPALHRVDRRQIRLRTKAMTIEIPCDNVPSLKKMSFQIVYAQIRIGIS